MIHGYNFCRNNGKNFKFNDQSQPYMGLCCQFYFEKLLLYTYAFIIIIDACQGPNLTSIRRHTCYISTFKWEIMLFAHLHNS